MRVAIVWHQRVSELSPRNDGSARKISRNASWIRSSMIAVRTEDAIERVMDRGLQPREQLALRRAIAIGGALCEREVVLPSGSNAELFPR